MAKETARQLSIQSVGDSAAYATVRRYPSRGGRVRAILSLIQQPLGDFRGIFLLLLIEVLLLALIRVPGDLGFENFGFTDTGDNLTANFLIGQGLIPAVDFGYHYGLLGLFAGRLWFGIFGQTPVAYVGAMWLCNVIIVWGIARFVGALKGGLAAIIAIAVMLPFAVSTGYQTFSAALEPLFLIHAMASQASGRRSAALALGAVAVFAKPAMGYFYGVVLIAFIFADLNHLPKPRLGQWIITLWPAAAVTIGLSALLIWYFSLSSLVRTILPLTGAHAYAVEHFGFFQAGSLFWRPGNPMIGYYLESAAGFWLVATALLLAAGLYSLTRFVCTGQLSATSEMVLCCSLLHLAAIFVLWGNQFSYGKYSFILVLGLVAALGVSPAWRYAVIAVAFLVPIAKVGVRAFSHLLPSSNVETISRITQPQIDPGQIAQTAHTYNFWRSERPDSVTVGLWATQADREEWRKVISIIRGHPTSMLMTDGCADLLFPEFMKPVGLHLDRALPLPQEFAAKLQQLRDSTMIVVAPGEIGLLKVWPQIGALVSRRFKVVFQGELFTVLEARPETGEKSLQTNREFHS